MNKDRCKILLVEDDTEMLELLAHNFEVAGFEVHCAGSGLLALNEARRVLPQVILLDLLLPDLDRLTVCEILRRQPSPSPIPVIMLTALGGRLSQFAGLDAGADEYLV